MRFISRRVGTWALLAGAAVAFALVIPSCHRSSFGSRIDVVALQRQMGAVIERQLTSAAFFNRRVVVSCSQAGSDGLHFSCHVDATNPTLPTQSWFENVTCNPPGDTDVPRCFSDHGEALQ